MEVYIVRQDLLWLEILQICGKLLFCHETFEVACADSMIMLVIEILGMKVH